MVRSFVFLLAVVCPVASAQSLQASVAGVVADALGAGVPGADITASNTATSVTFRTRSNDSGFYSLPALPIGLYVITVEKPGFKRSVNASVLLTTGQQLELNFQLELGAVSESVTVSGQASLLETRTSDQGQLLETKAVEDMPLGDRRTMNIVRMMGAAVMVNYDSGGKPNFSLAGGRTQSQNFYMDGGNIQNMRLGIGQVDTDPPVETVAEVKVLSNSYAAEYGGSAGGVVLATTKSGTNELHGAAYHFLRNEKMDAANFFAPWVNGAKQRAPLRYNIFGATIGGPVLIPKVFDGRNKAFFYFAYEGSRRNEGFTSIMTVPTAEQRAGNFSQTTTIAGALISIYDPRSTRIEAGRSIRDPYPGNIIPPARLDPVARNLVRFWPDPNRPPSNLTGANNFGTNFVQILTRDAFLVKGDINITDSDRLSVRYLYNSDNLDFSSRFPEIAAESNVPALRHQHFFFGNYVRVFSPNVVNDLRFNYGNRINHTRAYGLGGGWPAKLGLRGVPDDAFPQFNVPGMQSLGSANHERRQFPIQQFQYSNITTWIKGRNSFKFGFEGRPSYNFEVNRPSISGQFSFAVQATGLPGVAASGFGFASLMAGAVTNFVVRETEELDRNSWYWAWFVQDDWNISRNLTLNLGIRWETDTPIYDVNNRMNGFDLQRINPVSGTPGVVRFMGIDGFRTTPYNTDLNNFGPRIGFAWKPFGARRTVVRGGWGTFFAHPFDAGAPSSASLGFEVSALIQSPDNGVTIPFYLGQGVPPYNVVKPPLDDRFGAVPVGANPNTSVTFYEEDRRTGYSMQHNLTIQQDVGAGWMVEASYLANLSRKLASSNLSLNQVPPNLQSPIANQRSRPFPQFTNVLLAFPTLGVSSYHAFLLRAERRFAGGFNFLGTYTWSKFLNNTHDGAAVLGAEGGPYSDFYNRRADYGPSENDVRHRLTISSVWELPVGPGRRFLANSAWGKVVGSWNLGGLLTMQTGAPFTVTTQQNTVFSAAGALRADVSRNPNLPKSQRTLDRWFDTAAFSQPAPAQFGNQGVNILRADGIATLDLTVMRVFRLWSEASKLQVRGEAFNALNQANFGVPGRIFGAPGFGVVASARPARTLQVGLRLTY